MAYAAYYHVDISTNKYSHLCNITALFQTRSVTYSPIIPVYTHLHTLLSLD